MYIHQIDNTSFSGKWNLFNRLRGKSPKLPAVTRPVDTFILTPSPFADITKSHFLSEGREAAVYRTNNENYVLRIFGDSKFNPNELIPVNDGNGLILAANPNYTVQLLKYVKGKSLYGKNWNIVYSNLSIEEYLETFNKIKDLPDESFAEYIRTIAHYRKCGYDTDNLNPNNILLDGTHLNIVDIEKKERVEPRVHITDFYPLIDFFHTSEYMSYMSKNEVKNFTSDVKTLFDRIIKIAKKEGYKLDIGSISSSNILKWKC